MKEVFGIALGEFVLHGKTTPQQLLERLVSRGITINRFEIATPSAE